MPSSCEHLSLSQQHQRTGYATPISRHLDSLTQVSRRVDALACRARGAEMRCRLPAAARAKGVVFALIAENLGDVGVVNVGALHACPDLLINVALIPPQVPPRVVRIAPYALRVQGLHGVWVEEAAARLEKGLLICNVAAHRHVRRTVRKPLPEGPIAPGHLHVRRPPVATLGVKHPLGDLQLVPICLVSLRPKLLRHLGRLRAAPRLSSAQAERQA